MNTRRRSLLQAGCSSLTLGVAMAAGLLKPASVWASDAQRQVFEMRNLDSLMDSLKGTQAVTSNNISIICPDLAENGSVVPIEVHSGHPGTEAIVIMIDNNPFPLAAKFDLHAGALGYVSTRLRFAKSSNVRVLVRAGGKVYGASKPVKVTIGGCETDDAPIIPQKS